MIVKWNISFQLIHFRMRILRDDKDELPPDFIEHISKWALECKFHLVSYWKLFFPMSLMYIYFSYISGCVGYKTWLSWSRSSTEFTGPAHDKRCSWTVRVSESFRVPPTLLEICKHSKMEAFRQSLWYGVRVSRKSQFFQS